MFLKHKRPLQNFCEKHFLCCCLIDRRYHVLPHFRTCQQRLKTFGEHDLAKVFDDIIPKWQECEKILIREDFQLSPVNLSFLKAVYYSTLDHLKKVGDKYIENNVFAHVPYRFMGMFFVFTFTSSL